MKTRRENLTTALQHQYVQGYRKGHSEGYARGVMFTIQNYSSVILICLKDKFDFTPEQLQEVASHANSYFESICEGNVTFNDIASTLLEEDNLKISFDGTVVDVKEEVSSDI